MELKAANRGSEINKKLIRRKYKITFHCTGINIVAQNDVHQIFNYFFSAEVEYYGKNVNISFTFNLNVFHLIPHLPGLVHSICATLMSHCLLLAPLLLLAPNVKLSVALPSASVPISAYTENGKIVCYASTHGHFHRVHILYYPEKQTELSLNGILLQQHFYIPYSIYISCM